MAPNSKLFKREADEEEADELLGTTTLATKIFGKKHKHHHATTESDLDLGEF